MIINKDKQEKMNERARRYYTTHREEAREAGKKWRAANPKKERERHRKYRAANLEKIKERTKARERKIKIMILGYYSKGYLRCANCRYNILEGLALDHIDGGGNKQRKELGISAGISFYRWIRENNFPKGYQVLCHNCNRIKHDYPEIYLEIGNEHKERFKESPTAAEKGNEHKKNIFTQLMLF